MTNLTVGGMILDRKSADADNTGERAPADALARVPVSKIERSGVPRNTPTLRDAPAHGASCLRQDHHRPELERLMFDAGWHIALIDGRAMRTGLSRDLKCTAPERVENLRRVDVAKLMNDAGSPASARSPHRRARACAGQGRSPPTASWDMQTDTPLEVCRSRDGRTSTDRPSVGRSHAPGSHRALRCHPTRLTFESRPRGPRVKRRRRSSRPSPASCPPPDPNTPGSTMRGFQRAQHGVDLEA